MAAIATAAAVVERLLVDVLFMIAILLRSVCRLVVVLCLLTGEDVLHMVCWMSCVVSKGGR